MRSSLGPKSFEISWNSPIWQVVGSPSERRRPLRSANGRLMENIVQHTAPLNLGNSGGPLVDSRGRIVGISTAMIVARLTPRFGFARSQPMEPERTAALFSTTHYAGDIRKARQIPVITEPLGLALIVPLWY